MLNWPRFVLVGLLATSLTQLGPLARAEEIDDEPPTATATPTYEASPTPSSSPQSSPTPSERSGPAPRKGTPTPKPSPAADVVQWPISDDQPADYDIPYGHFFSQPVPGARKGFGFSIADAAGVPFWTDYQRLGGFDRLGYPLSRPFLSKKLVVQATQGGVMRWD